MGTSKQKLFLHIGYPKTATTVLQKHYFPLFSDVFYAGINYFEKNKFLIPKSAVECLVYGDVLQARKIGCTVSDELVKKSKGKNILLSFEKIIGSLFTPRRNRHGNWQFTSLRDTADTIKALFNPDIFDLVLIVTLRNQAEILPSKYAQSYSSAYVYFNEYSNFNRFINDLCRIPDNKIRIGLDYNRIIQFFELEFGRDKVNILLFEQFKESPPIFLQQFCSILSIEYDEIKSPFIKKENVRLGADGSHSHSPVSVLNLLGDIKRKFLPWIPFHSPRFLGFLGKLHSPWQSDPGEIKLDRQMQDNILNLYRESNRHLSERLCLNLERYRYFSTNS